MCIDWFCASFLFTSSLTNRLKRTFECLPLIFCFWLKDNAMPPFWKPQNALMIYPSLRVKWNANKFLSPLDLIRYRLALSAWALNFYDDTAELVKSTVHQKVKSERVRDSLSPVARGNRCGNIARSPSQYNSKRCFTEAIVLHTYMHGFVGLVGGSVTSSAAPHQQLAFTTL